MKSPCSLSEGYGWLIWMPIGAAASRALSGEGSREAYARGETQAHPFLSPFPMKFDNAFVADELLPNPKFVNDLFVPIEVFTLEIVQQLAALTDHSKQTAPGMDVIFMRLEVIRQ
jgi:hypothetical protein